MMNLTDQVKEFVCQNYGKVKKLYGNAKGFSRKVKNFYGKIMNSSVEKWKKLYGPTIFYVTSTVF